MKRLHGKCKILVRNAKCNYSASLHIDRVALSQVSRALIECTWHFEKYQVTSRANDSYDGTSKERAENKIELSIQTEAISGEKAYGFIRKRFESA